jgi:hypothetical protein
MCDGDKIAIELLDQVEGLLPSVQCVSMFTAFKSKGGSSLFPHALQMQQFQGHACCTDAVVIVIFGGFWTDAENGLLVFVALAITIHPQPALLQNGNYCCCSVVFFGFGSGHTAKSMK